MTPERWGRIKSLFAGAVEVLVDRRRAWLEHEAAGDRGLVAKVESLLNAQEKSGAFLEGIPAQARVDALGTDLQLGQRVGAYRIVELIGCGGMGDVYKAVRDDDQYRSEVAIKIMLADVGAAHMYAGAAFTGATGFDVGCEP